MRTLYFDCFSGASGDMILGALVDLGLDVASLRLELNKLALDGYEINVSKVTRSALAATKVDVVVDGKYETVHGHVVEYGAHSHEHHHHDDHDHGHHHEHHHSGDEHSHSRGLVEILGLIDRSDLSAQTKQLARRAFERLGDAEARAHGVTPAEVHFHEVGAVDAIIDVVGAFLGFELLGIERFVCSPLNVGGGSVTFSHGTYPVPAPATSELLRGVPIYAGEVKKEMLTPTGAAILTTIASEYGALPAMTVDRIGYGAGTRDVANHPNVLRVFLGETDAEITGKSSSVVVMEATIDDMTPEMLGYFVERALSEGALDVYLTAVQMKKNRPGVHLTVLLEPKDFDRISYLVFRETTTIGFRYGEVSRRVLDREQIVVDTPAGPIRVKVARLDGAVVNAAPEYDDCREAAIRGGLPLRDVQAMAVAAFAGRERA